MHLFVPGCRVKLEKCKLELRVKLHHGSLVATPVKELWFLLVFHGAPVAVVGRRKYSEHISLVVPPVPGLILVLIENEPLKLNIAA